MTKFTLRIDSDNFGLESITLMMIKIVMSCFSIFI